MVPVSARLRPLQGHRSPSVEGVLNSRMPVSVTSCPCLEAGKRRSVQRCAATAACHALPRPAAQGESRLLAPGRAQGAGRAGDGERSSGTRSLASLGGAL